MIIEEKARVRERAFVFWDKRWFAVPDIWTEIINRVGMIVVETPPLAEDYGSGGADLIPKN